MIADEMQPKIDTNTAAASSRPAVGPRSAVVASSPILREAQIGQRHRAEVDQVHQQVQQADERGAANRPERQIPFGTPDFTRGQGRLVPPVEVAQHRHYGEPHRGQQVSRWQRRGPIHRNVGRYFQAEADQGGDGHEFDRRQKSLNGSTLFRPEIVHNRQHRDRANPRGLRSVRLPGPDSQRNRRDHVRRQEERYKRPEIVAKSHAEVGYGPAWIASSEVHPKRKPHNGPNACLR